MRQSLAVLLGTVLLAAGCTGGSDSDSASNQDPTASSPASDTASPDDPASDTPGCPGSGAWEPLDADGPLGMVAGNGNVAVVFVNTADGDACDWFTYGDELVAQGHRVALWDYATAGGPVKDRLAELDAVVDQVRAAGSSKVLLVGGSRGGCLSLLYAEANRAVSGVAVLSCAKVWNREDPTPLAKHLPQVTVPVLSVIADADPDVPRGEVRSDLAGLGSSWKNMLVVKGSGHGTDLLEMPKVRAALDEFIASPGRR